MRGKIKAFSASPARAHREEQLAGGRRVSHLLGLRGPHGGRKELVFCPGIARSLASESCRPCRGWVPGNERPQATRVNSNIPTFLTLNARTGI